MTPQQEFETILERTGLLHEARVMQQKYGRKVWVTMDEDGDVCLFTEKPYHACILKFWMMKHEQSMRILLGRIPGEHEIWRYCLVELTCQPEKESQASFTEAHLSPLREIKSDDCWL